MSSVIISGDTSGAVTVSAPAVAGTNTLTLQAATATSAVNTLGTAVTASSTAVDFTGIPSWVKRITVMLNGVSTSGTSSMLIQLGDSGGIETTGYTAAAYNETGGANSASTAGFSITPTSTAAAAYNGSVILSLLGSNTFVAQGTLFRSGTTGMSYIAGVKSLSDTLDRLRITTINGTDTFDAGSVNLLLEG